MRLSSNSFLALGMGATFALTLVQGCTDDTEEDDATSSSSSGVPTTTSSGMMTTSSGMGGMVASSSSSSSSSAGGMGGAGGTGGMMATGGAGGMGGATGGMGGAMGGMGGAMGGMGGMGGAGGAGGGMTVVLNEDFADDLGFVKLDGNNAAAMFFSDGTNDYWGISDGTTGGDFDGDTAPNITGDYMGFNGNFLTLQDGDGEGLTLPAAMQWQNLNITNLNNLQISFKLADAAAQDMNNDMDAADFLRFEVIIDGGAPVNIVEFRGDMTTNGVFREDTNLDGTGDGAVAVGPTAATVTKAIAGTGNTLTLVVTASLNAGDEDIGLDDIVIVGN